MTYKIKVKLWWIVENEVEIEAASFDSALDHARETVESETFMPFHTKCTEIAASTNVDFHGRRPVEVGPGNVPVGMPVLRALAMTIAPNTELADNAVLEILSAIGLKLGRTFDEDDNEIAV